MSVENDFLIFANNATNIETQANYLTDPALINGVSSGIASSAQFNKVTRQATTGMALIAAFIQQQLPNQTVIDNGAAGLSALVASFTNALESVIGPWTSDIWQDSGTSDLVEITLSPVPSSLTSLDGSVISVLKGNDPNTGGVNIIVNGFTATPVVRADGTQFNSGEWPAGAVGRLVYDGTNFVCVNNPAPSLLAPINSPALTGSPTAPTQPSNISNTTIATTAFVNGLGFVNELYVTNNFTNNGQFGGNIVNTNANTSLTAAQSGKTIFTNTTQSLVLPAVSIGINYKIFLNPNGPVTLSTTGSAVLIFPDGSSSSSLQGVFNGWSGGWDVICDGTNWKTVPFDAPVVPPNITEGNRAPSLFQIQQQFAPISGNAGQQFSVGYATVGTSAVPFSQAQASFAALNGNSNEPFYADTSPSTGAGVDNVVNVNFLNQYYVSGAYNSSGGTDTTTSITLSFTASSSGSLFAIGCTNTGGTYSGNGVNSNLNINGTEVSSDSTTLPQTHSGAIPIAAGESVYATYTGGSVSSFSIHLTLLFIPNWGATL